jgi:hypothetical protein
MSSWRPFLALIFFFLHTTLKILILHETNLQAHIT